MRDITSIISSTANMRANPPSSESGWVRSPESCSPAAMGISAMAKLKNTVLSTNTIVTLGVKTWPNMRV